MYKIDNYIKLLVKSKYNGGSDSNNINSNKLIRNSKYRGGAAATNYPVAFLQELLFRKSTTNAADAAAAAAGVFELKNQDSTAGGVGATDLTRLIAGFNFLGNLPVAENPLAYPLARAFDPAAALDNTVRLVPGNSGPPPQAVDAAGVPIGVPVPLTPAELAAPNLPDRWFSQWSAWDGRRGQKDIIAEMRTNFDYYKERTDTTARNFFLDIAVRLAVIAAAPVVAIVPIAPPGAPGGPFPVPASVPFADVPATPRVHYNVPGGAGAGAGGAPGGGPGGGPAAAGGPGGLAAGIGAAAAALGAAAAGAAIVPVPGAAAAAGPTRSLRKKLIKGMRYGIIKNSHVIDVQTVPVVIIEIETYTIIQVGDKIDRGAEEDGIYDYYFTILSGPHKGKRVLIPLDFNLIPYEENQDSGPAIPLGFKVDLYKNTGGGDVLLGSRTATRNDTIKSVIDSVKGGNPNQRCIVTSHKNFLNSIGPKDYYVTFGNLRLQYEQVELWLI